MCLKEQSIVQSFSSLGTDIVKVQHSQLRSKVVINDRRIRKEAPQIIQIRMTSILMVSLAQTKQSTLTSGTGPKPIYLIAMEVYFKDQGPIQSAIKIQVSIFEVQIILLPHLSYLIKSSICIPPILS